MIEEIHEENAVEVFEIAGTGDVTSEETYRDNRNEDQPEQKRSRRFQCQLCASGFPRQTELNTHKWLVHGIFCSLLLEECQQPNCNFTCESKGLLLEHLYFTHDVDVKLISAQLDTENDFDVWLQQFQYENGSEFQLCTTQSNSKYRTRLYTCVHEAQPKRCDPHKTCRLKKQCAAHLLVKVPRPEGKGKIEVLGSSHHNHITVHPGPSLNRDISEDEEPAMLPQSASLLEMFQTAQQVIQISDELRADVSVENTTADLAQVEMKILQLKQVLQAYDQAVSMPCSLLDDIPQVAESATVIMDEGDQIEIEGDATLVDQDHQHL